jgi:hypothetical protein
MMVIPVETKPSSDGFLFKERNSVMSINPYEEITELIENIENREERIHSYKVYRDTLIKEVEQLKEIRPEHSSLPYKYNLIQEQTKAIKIQQHELEEIKRKFNESECA